MADETRAARRGRPRVPDDQRQTERIEIRMTAAQRAKLEALGGAEFVRRVIDRSRLPG